jgi:hypothetical protein
MDRKVRETAKPERLCHQREILVHHPLLHRHQLCDSDLHSLDGEDLVRLKVVVEVPATAPRERIQPGGTEGGALVEHVGAGRRTENVQHAVDVEKREIVDRDEIGGTRLVDRPAVAAEVVHRIERRRRPFVFDLHADAAVELGRRRAARDRSHPAFLAATGPAGA